MLSAASLKLLSVNELTNIKFSMIILYCYLFININHSRLKHVLFDVGVRHDDTNTVLREAVLLDTKLSKHLLDRRIYITITFQLDNDEIARAALDTCLKILETDIKVDGEPFGLPLIDEGDTVKPVLDHRPHLIQVHAHLLFEKSRYLRLCQLILSRYLNAGLRRAAVVVFLLHFQEGDVRFEVGSYPHFFSGIVTVMMGHVKKMRGGIPIGSQIRIDTITIKLLRVIFACCHLKQFEKRPIICDKLRINPVHQAYRRHLVKRY